MMLETNRKSPRMTRGQSAMSDAAAAAETRAKMGGRRTASAHFIFDPDSPDAEILIAYEKARASGAECYALLLADQSDAAEVAAATQIAAEDIVFGNFATTPEGIRTRLQLAIVHQSQALNVDMLLKEHGFLALYKHRSDLLDGNDQQIAEAAVELLDFEWERRVDEYRTSVTHFELAISIKDCVDQLSPDHGGADSSELVALRHLLAEAENVFSNETHLTRLIRTPVPSHDALGVKIQIAIDEGVSDEAGPWIARDVAFLAGLNAPLPADRSKGGE